LMVLPGNRLDRSRSKPAFGARAAGAKQVDGLVALIHQRRGGRIGWLQSPQLGVELRDLGHRGIGLTHRNVDVLLGIGTQRLNALRRRIELLRQ